MALCSSGPIQLWPYIVMAQGQYNFDPIQLWPYTVMAYIIMSLCIFMAQGLYIYGPIYFMARDSYSGM